MMLFYSEEEGPRLRYVTAFIGRELLAVPVTVTTRPEIFAGYEGPKLQYGGVRLPMAGFYIPAVSLLFETGLRPQPLQFFFTGHLPMFFGGQGELPFDLLAGIFFLLSRYEEWLPFQPDEYGRFPPEASVAFENEFLERPLIDEWLCYFQQKLLAVFPALKFREKSFRFLPTYDIDMAWSYAGKGFFRNAGGVVRDLRNGNFAAVKERRAVLSGVATDPFDSFDWMDELHTRYDQRPHYFVLLADKSGRLDKNVSPSDPRMKALVRKLASRYDTGIHPSWQSGDDKGLLLKEINTLRVLSGAPVLSSRQHYLRLTMPVTYRRLLDAGIRQDFSMGYGTANGFRASFTGDFYWYDLDLEKETELLLTPFCFMDFAAFHGTARGADATLDALRNLATVISRVNGRMVTLWHNHFLGPPLLRDWRDAYGQFVGEMATGKAK